MASNVLIESKFRCNLILFYYYSSFFFCLFHNQTGQICYMFFSIEFQPGNQFTSSLLTDPSVFIKPSNAVSVSRIIGRLFRIKMNRSTPVIIMKGNIYEMTAHKHHMVKINFSVCVIPFDLLLIYCRLSGRRFPFLYHFCDFMP